MQLYTVWQWPIEEKEEGSHKHSRGIRPIGICKPVYVEHIHWR